MRNLLENAQRYANGTMITASVTALAPHGARLCIVDRRPGIAASEREHIFEPFYRAVSMRERHDGVGLRPGSIPRRCKPPPMWWGSCGTQY